MEKVINIILSFLMISFLYHIASNYIRCCYVIKLKKKIKLWFCNNLWILMIEKIENCWEITLVKIGKERMAYICQLLSCIFWVFSFTYVIDHQLNAIETLLAKGLTGTFFSYMFILMFNISIKLDSHTLKYINRICVLDALQILSLAFTQLYLAMPIVHSISCTIIVVTPLI